MIKLMGKRSQYLIVPVVIVVVIAGIAALSVTQTAAPKVRAAGNSDVDEVGVVERGDVALTVSATGPIQPVQNVSLAFPISGTVKTVNVAEGDYVLKGQTLATLDNQDMLDAVLLAQSKVLNQQIALRRLTDKPRDIDVKVATAALTLAQAQLYEAQHSGADPIQVKISALNVESAKNQLWQIELQRDIDDKTKKDLLSNPRTVPLGNAMPTDNQHNGAIVSKDYGVKIAEAQLGDAKSQAGDIAGVGAAQAAVVSAQTSLNDLINGGNAEEVAQAQAQLQAAQSALKVAKSNLARTTLVAPFDGVVAKLNLHVGGRPLSDSSVIMLDTHSFYVDIPVNETGVYKMALDQPVTLTFDALPGVTLNGKVSRIADVGTKKGDTVAYTVRVEIDPAGQSLLSNLSASATIITGEARNVLRVRNRFIRMDRGSGKAFIDVRQPDGSYQAVEVTLGVRNDTYTEIKGNVQAGAAIAVLPNSTAQQPKS